MADIYVAWFYWGIYMPFLFIISLVYAGATLSIQVDM